MRRVFAGLKATDRSRSTEPGKVPTNLARAEGSNHDASRPPILSGKLAGEILRNTHRPPIAAAPRRVCPAASPPERRQLPASLRTYCNPRATPGRIPNPTGAQE